MTCCDRTPLVEAARLRGDRAALGHDVGGGAALHGADVGGGDRIDASQRHPRDRARCGLDRAAALFGDDACVRGAAHERRMDLAKGRRGRHDAADRAGVIEHERDRGLGRGRIEALRALKADLLTRGQDEVDARVGQAFGDDPTHGFDHRGHRGLVVAAQDVRAVVREEPVGELDLDGAVVGNGVEVRAQRDRRAALGRGRKPRHDVAATGGDVLRRPVFGQLRAERTPGA